MKITVINKFVEEYFTRGILKLSGNRYNTNRTDAWVTMYRSLY